jgi:hypothetical protein
MWRQGDILIDRCTEVPKHASRLKHLILASGDATGHRHTIRDRKAATLYGLGGELYLDVSAEKTDIVHPEHDDVTLPRGVYRIWKQREYSEARPRPVVD